MSLHIDTRELEALAADFSDGPGRVQRGARTVIDRSARRVQDAQRRDASGHRYLGKLPGTVGRSRIGDLEMEVGFDKGGQGSLANILVFGSINNAPIMKSPADHALRDMPRLVRDAEQMAEGAVLGDD
jgi:hypothetical protein